MTPREAWLLRNRVPALLAALAARKSDVMDPEKAFRLFRATDPSRNGASTDWLMRTYAKG